jgi:NAD(P)-dependent dehydrogenase (short-subunit alcohol dehydrogenase family)
MRFKERVVVISGGYSGIGQSSKELFLNEGASVYILDKQIIHNARDNEHFIHCDVSIAHEVEKAIKHIFAQEKKIDIAFCNAGIYYVGTIEDTPIEIIENVINVNLKGILYMLKFILPIMKQQLAGKIILMGSDQCFIGKSNSSIYGATKGAIGQLTKSTAIDYAAYNINVNCICPATTNTPLVDEVINIWNERYGHNKKEVTDFFTRNQLFKRMAKPEEIARVVLFLASDDASFITGSLVPIDGGLTAA